MKRIFLVGLTVVCVVVILGIIIGLSYLEEEKNKQEFYERWSVGHSNCMSIKDSGADWDQFIECEAEYIKDIRLGCMKYSDIQGCDKVEELIEEYGLGDTYP